MFKLAKEKRVAWLLEHRGEVIEKLNRDLSKPWFGWKKDGRVTELQDRVFVADSTFDVCRPRAALGGYFPPEPYWRLDAED